MAVDATMVRCLLVPAVMVLLGRSNWWMPRWLDRALPNISIEGGEWLRQHAAEQEERAGRPARGAPEGPGRATPVDRSEVVMYVDAMLAAETTLTEFLRHSGDVLAHVDRGDVRLHRRDGADLYLKRADREEAEQQSLTAAGRLLVRMLHNDATSDALLAIVGEALPWTRFLPDRDRAEFVTEFARTLEASADVDNFAAVGTVLAQWRATAEAWADPQVRAALDAQLEPGDPAPRPVAQ